MSPVPASSQPPAALKRANIRPSEAEFWTGPPTLSPAAHTDHRRRLLRYLPQVLVATFVMTAGPLLAVWTARASGLVMATLPLILLGIVVSLALSAAGSAYWKTRSGSGDLLFGELMLWGWLWRWRTERRLESAIALLGLTGKAQRARIGDLGPARQVQLLEDLAAALEARDPYTHGHSQRVARHASVIAERMGLSRGQVARIRAAAAIHDVGKIETPNGILNKKGQLTDEEFAVIQRHPFLGARMVYPLGDEQLAWMVLYHHERLDGGGYPLGLSGEDIPLGARIIAVADTFDALTSTRPYRTARSHRLALRILAREAGTRLDPAVVRAFTSHYSAHRSVAAWALLSSLPQRLLFPFVGEINAVGGAGSAAKVIAATAAAAAVGSAAVGQPIASPLQHQAVADLPAVKRADAGFPDLRTAAEARNAASAAERHEVAGMPVPGPATDDGNGTGSLQLSVRGAPATTGTENGAAIVDTPVTLVPADPGGSSIGEAPAVANPAELPAGDAVVSVEPADPGIVPAAEHGQDPTADSGAVIEAPVPNGGDDDGQAKPQNDGGGQGGAGGGAETAGGEAHGHQSGDAEAPGDGGSGAVLDEIDPGSPDSTDGADGVNDGAEGDDQTPGNAHGGDQDQGNAHSGDQDPGTADGDGDTVAEGGVGAMVDAEPEGSDIDAGAEQSDGGNDHGSGGQENNGQSNGHRNDGKTDGNGRQSAEGADDAILDEIEPDASATNDGPDATTGDVAAKASRHDRRVNRGHRANYGARTQRSGIETILAEIDPSGGEAANILLEIDPASSSSALETTASIGTVGYGAVPTTTVVAPTAAGSSYATYAAPSVVPAAGAGPRLRSIAGALIGIFAGSPQSGSAGYGPTSPPVDPAASQSGTVDAAVTEVPEDVAAVTGPAGEDG